MAEHDEAVAIAQRRVIEETAKLEARVLQLETRLASLETRFDDQRLVVSEIVEVTGKLVEKVVRGRS